MQKWCVLHLLFLGFLVSCGGDRARITLQIEAPEMNFSFAAARTRIQGGNGTFCQTSLNPPSSNNTGPGDPFIDTQWYLDRFSIRQIWNHAEVDAGEGIRIGIIDDGVEIAHEDLKNNVVPGLSLNFISGATHPDNPLPEDCAEGTHGTNVAGIIAAEGDNGLGIKGITHNAEIFATNYASDRQSDRLATSLTLSMNATAISVNAWEDRLATRLRRVDQASFVAPIEMGLDEGYGGKGISYVFTGGNGRDFQPMSRPAAPTGRPYEHLTTYDEQLNQPGVIPVCSAGLNNEVTLSSTSGGNLWICGISSSTTDLPNPPELWPYYGAPTTDLSGDTAGENRVRPDDPARCPTIPFAPFPFSRCFNFGRSIFAGSGSLYVTPAGNPYDIEFPAVANATNYHRFFEGSTPSVPLVSGVIALMRDANPDLSWRDVKLILAETADQVDPDRIGDQINLPWQEGGIALANLTKRYTHHHDYGFGVVNASAAVELALAWPSDRVGVLKKISISANAFPNGRRAFSVTGDNKDGMDFVEYIQLKVTSNHTDVGELTIRLTSPGGVESRLAQPRSCLDHPPGETPDLTNDCADLLEGFTFGATAHLGEDPAGDWQLAITPAVTGAAELIIYGHTR